MKKATGPGKVETSLTPEGTGGVVALLFNFDFDDATVKPEHQAFLSEQVAPRLKAGRSLRVFLRGTASRIGNADYNLQLSRRRVEAVRNFLTGKGVRPAQIVAKFTGENLSTSKLADDERDWAVEAIFEASTGPARFERGLPVGRNDGFDERPDPQTVMVAEGTPRFVRLIGAAGAVVESLNPAVLRLVDPFRPAAAQVVATSNNFLLRLQPGVLGETQLVAHLVPAAAENLTFTSLVVRRRASAARRRARRKEVGIRAAAVAVTMPLRTVGVAFHYVKNGPNGQPAPAGVRTQRNPNPIDEDQWLAHMNRIYEPQANIRFVRAGPSLVVGSNGVRGPDVDATGGPDDDSKKIFETAGANTTARFRVFFVGRIGSFTMTHGAIVPQIGTPNCLCQDGLRVTDRFGTLEALTTDVLKVAQVLAHEAGHAFGEKDQESDKSLLMFHIAAEGEHIPLDVAGRMNAAARK